jgi:hypothetical protein
MIYPILTITLIFYFLINAFFAGISWENRSHIKTTLFMVFLGTPVFIIISLSSLIQILDKKWKDE